MGAIAKIPTRMTVAEFLDWPGDGSRRKFQLIDGDPRAMAPASITHGIIQANFARLSGNHLTATGSHVVVEPGVVIVEDRLRFLEGDAVFLLVALGLGRVPRKTNLLHNYNVNMN